MSIDRQKVIDAAQKYAAKGQFDKAIVEYMRLVKEDPSDVRILLKIGDLQVRGGAKNDAISTYSRVAIGYDQQGFFLKAIAVYKQILSIDPNLTDLYAKLAEMYVKLGLVPDALAHLDALAQRYARAGQDEDVVQVYQQMVQVDASNVACHIKLAELLSKLGRGTEAAQEFELGCALLREAGRQDDWAKVAERLLFHRPNDATVARDLARHYLARQDTKRALPKLQVSFKSNAKDVDTLEMLGQAFRELGQLPKTISVLKEVARIHQENGAQDKRNETYRRVLEISPNDTEAKEALRGASRMGRRPSSPPTGPVKKASSPGMPAQRAAPAAPPPTIEEEEVVEEIVVDDAEETSEPAPPPVAAPPARVAPPAPPPARVPAPPPAATAPPRQPTSPPGQIASGLPRSAIIEPPRRPTGPVPVAPPAPAPSQVPSRAAPPPPPPPAPSNPAAELARIVGEAEIFLKYGLRPKAIAHFHRALEIDPNNIDLHARLRDMYAEQGDVAGTVQHTIAVAEILAATDPGAAVGEVTRALEMDPNNAEAMDLFQRLGGHVAPPHPGGAGYVEEVYPPEYADPNADAYADGTAPGNVASMGAGAGGGTARDIEEGLEEAEFFVTQGLYDEARDTLSALYQQHPNHPLIVERLEELESLLQAQAGGQDDQAFALAEKLAEEVDQVQQNGGASVNPGNEMIDVETVFAQFKKGVEKAVSADDADTHYDLGIAYKEMGLTDDAMNEFRIASQNPRKHCQAEMMIGLCSMEKNDVATAIDHFKRALQAPNKTDREEMALYFELGSAYEAVGDLSEAMYFFQKVEKRDPTFRGVRQRVQRLAAHVNSGTRAQPQSTAALDDVDRAFDELLKG